MSHFDKTVMKKIIITTNGKPTDTWIKNLLINIVEIKDN